MFIFKMYLLAPFTDQNDRSSYPFIYFNQWILHTFICLRPEKGAPSGWSLCVHYRERPYQVGGGGPHVAHLNFKTSRVGNACHLLSALPSLSQFGRGMLSLVAISFHELSWAMLLVGIYP